MLKRWLLRMTPLQLIKTSDGNLSFAGRKGVNKRLKWLCNARVDLDYETMKAMKKAGCRLIIPGIESGSQQILDNIKKGTKVEQFYSYVSNAKKLGF